MNMGRRRAAYAAALDLPVWNIDDTHDADPERMDGIDSHASSLRVSIRLYILPTYYL